MRLRRKRRITYNCFVDFGLSTLLFALTYMILTDKIYGTFAISDACVEEILAAPSFQRLKGVWQNGLPPRYIGAHMRSWTFTRYEHSIGVFLLLRKLGASREEQIAGLLHDASHMAFSHAHDWIFEDYTKSVEHETSQDARHESYIRNTEFCGILERYGLSVDGMVHHEAHVLLERDIPDLCVDRIDYFLRELPIEEAKQYISNLTVYKSKIVFRDGAVTLRFATEFLKHNRESWASYDSASRYHILAKVMRYALTKGYVHEPDFKTTDDAVLARIESVTDDEIIKKYLNLLLLDTMPPDGPHILVHHKHRYVDPLFWRNGVVVRLSEDNAEFARLIESERKIFEAPIPVFDGEV